MTIILVDIAEQPAYLMERIDITPNLIPEEHIFETFEEFVEWIKNGNE